MKYILILLISLSFLSIDTFARGGRSGGSSSRISSSPSRSSSRSSGWGKSSSSSSSSSSRSGGWSKSTYTKSTGNTQGYSSRQSSQVYVINNHQHGYYSYRGFGFWDYYLWMHIMYPRQNVNNYYGSQTKNSCKSDRECLVREKCDILQNTCMSR